MKPEKILEVIHLYRELLSPDYEPQRFSEELFSLNREYASENKSEYLQHARYAIDRILDYVQIGTQSKIEKAHRWLGWVQCILAITGTRSMAQCALDNAPEGVTYDRDA